MNLKEMRQTRRAELLNVKRRNFKCAGKRNDHMLHYEQVMFLRGEKVNVVQYWWNIFVKLKGEQVIILQMDQRLKTKNISDVPGQISCCQCKYLVNDTGNEFTECQTPRKKFQWIGISPVSLHAFTKTLKSDISEAQKVQVNGLNNWVLFLW